MPKLVTLDAWVSIVYGDAITIATARRWCREGRIVPEPQKCGRTYFVEPDARYTDTLPEPAPEPGPAQTGNRLIDRIRNVPAVPA